MPQPLPQYEIFVYSPRFEGVHLRAGKVARGGHYVGLIGVKIFAPKFWV